MARRAVGLHEPRLTYRKFDNLNHLLLAQSANTESHCTRPLPGGKADITQNMRRVFSCAVFLDRRRIAKLWLEITRPGRSVVLKAPIKTKPSAAIVAAGGLTGTGGNGLALRSLVIVNSAGHPAVFFSRANSESRETQQRATTASRLRWMRRRSGPKPKRAPILHQPSLQRRVRPGACDLSSATSLTKL